MKKCFARFACAVLALALLAAPASALTVPEALELLEERYYFDIPESAYEADSLDELFQQLGDPYTYYMSREEYEAFLADVEGEVNLVGIGAVIRLTQEGLQVDSVVSGGSAQESGLQAGDLIVAVDGVSCVPAQQGHRELLVGEEGATVEVSVLRNGETKEYTLTRRALHIPNTEVKLLEGGVGYIDCNSFGTDTGKTFLRALEENGIPYDDSLVLRGELIFATGYQGFLHMMGLAAPPTAIFSTNSDITIGVITAARERGVNIPNDVTVFGYDCVDVCSMMTPPLPVVYQPEQEIGRTAAQWLIRRLEGDGDPPRTVRLKCSLQF